MPDEKDLNTPESQPQEGNPQIPGSPIPDAPGTETPLRLTPDPQPARPSSSESEYLIPESMRKLDALLKEIKARPKNPLPLPARKSDAQNEQANAQLLNLIQEKLDALGDKISEVKLPQPSPAPSVTSADLNAQVVDVMQGKLDAMGEKITEKLATLLGELKSTVGPDREAKIKEIQEVAGPEVIDISKLFDEKVSSNLGEIGIEEKEAKEVDKSLEKLRKLRGGK